MSELTASGAFSDFEGRTWLNTAHQGALPLCAAAEANQAVTWKTSPFALTQEQFDGVPQRLRTNLASLLNAPSSEIVLSNSASYGLHLLAHAFPWQAGDEVIVVEGDFPSNILPWLLAEKRYEIVVRRVRPRQNVLQPDELEAALTPRTRVFCASWVHSFSGFVSDIDALGTVCQRNGVYFVINGSQGIGARLLDVSRLNAHAVASVGFKWLCGPYGTGFAWLHPTLLSLLRPVKAYWLSSLTAEDLGKEVLDVKLQDGIDVRSLDIFSTANFFNFKPFAAAVEFILQTGLRAIEGHNEALVDQFISNLDPGSYEIFSPKDPESERSTLIFFSHRDRGRNRGIYEALLRNGIYTAYRAGKIRLSPHFYNTLSDIDRTLSVLHDAL